MSFFFHIPIHAGDSSKMDLLFLINYTRPNGHEHTLRLVDKLAPVWKRMGCLLGNTTHQLNTIMVTDVWIPQVVLGQLMLSYFL